MSLLYDLINIWRPRTKLCVCVCGLCELGEHKFSEYMPNLSPCLGFYVKNNADNFRFHNQRNKPPKYLASYLFNGILTFRFEPCEVLKRVKSKVLLFITARTWKQPRCPPADEWIRKLWCIYTMEYYSAIKKNTFESVLMKWMKLEPIIQSEVSQKDKYQYSILTRIYGI